MDRVLALIQPRKFEITLKIGIALPQAGQQATRENVIQMADLADTP